MAWQLVFPPGIQPVSPYHNSVSPTLAGSSTDVVGQAEQAGDSVPTKGRDLADKVHLPKTFADVKGPSAEEIARHNLTHLPYRSWCRWCVLSRKPNPKHVRSHFAKRDIPLLVGGLLFYPEPI